MGRKPTPISQRLMNKVIEQGDCLIFTGKKYSNGYGQITEGNNGKTFYRLAHRVAYEAFVGPLSATDVVCHSCDNRACVKPKHLFKGTNQDNSTDMVNKNRVKKPALKIGDICPNGHLLIGDNARPRKSRGKNNNNAIRCAECARIAVRKYNEKKSGRKWSGNPHNKYKTHCKRGHELTKENVYINPTSKGRQCRSCMGLRRIANADA